jgi:hypothetical protein
MPQHVQLKGSVGKGGDNYPWDVFKVQYDLAVLIAEKKFFAGTPVFPHGVCDRATIEAIILFQNRYGLHPANGRIDPASPAAQTLYSERSYSVEKKPPLWKYKSSTGSGITLGAFGASLGVSKMTLYVADSNDVYNKFSVKCVGAQAAGGKGLSPSPIGGGVEWSSASHPATGGEVERMPRGNNPILPSDFEGVVLLDAVSASTFATLDLTNSYPNKGTFGIVRTFARSLLPVVTATVAAYIASPAQAGAAPAARQMRKALDRMAKTRGWIAGGAASFHSDGPSVEQSIAVFTSKIERD